MDPSLFCVYPVGSRLCPFLYQTKVKDDESNSSTVHGSATLDPARTMVSLGSARNDRDDVPDNTTITLTDSLKTEK